MIVVGCHCCDLIGAVRLRLRGLLKRTARLVVRINIRIIVITLISTRIAGHVRTVAIVVGIIATIIIVIVTIIIVIVATIIIVSSTIISISDILILICSTGTRLLNEVGIKYGQRRLAI